MRKNADLAQTSNNENNDDGYKCLGNIDQPRLGLLYIKNGRRQPSKKT